jgi:hypothetical protein
MTPAGRRGDKFPGKFAVCNCVIHTTLHSRRLQDAKAWKILQFVQGRTMEKIPEW